MKKQVILFDLDGTLTNPKEGITKSVAYALDKFDIKVESLDELCVFIGPPLLESFMKYYDMKEEQATQAIVYYREYFIQRGMLENVQYDGIAAMLNILKEQGKTLLVATSKPWVFAKQILEHFHLASYFNGIYGSELDGTRSQKAEVIAYALHSEGISAQDCVMVGDRKHDILGAKEHHMKSVGVLYGYGSCDELKQSGADVIVKTIDELKEVLS